MECERLQRLIKSWYVQVQDETMAPARMVSFMETHLAECHVCLADPLVRQEVEKITAIVLPPSKVRKPTTAEEEEEEVVEEASEDDEAGSYGREEDMDEAGEDEGDEMDEEIGDEDDLEDEDDL
ncbi:MAG: hypothetical protein ACOY3Z_10810 [Thermodesulfobacteriota bacterium]